MAKKKGEGGGGGERWLLTYADLITLLLAFFIILYASSKADLERFEQIGKAFQQTFGILNLGGGGGFLNDAGGVSIFDFEQLSAPQKQFLGVSEELGSYVSANGLAEQVAVNLRTEGIAITLSNALLFPSGGAVLDPESQETLAKVAELIRPMPNEIRIEAHTDNLPTNTPQYPTNWELSAARASAVARHLIEAEGIEASRLSVTGYGEYRPLFPNDTREYRLMNRRADIVILFPSERVAPIIDLMADQ